MIANTARNPKKKPSPWEPDDFNPYSEKKAIRQRGNIHDLRDVFVEKSVNLGNRKRKER